MAMTSIPSPYLNQNPAASTTSDTTLLSHYQPTLTPIITSTLICILVIHIVLSWLDYPILSLPELLWNAFVWLMPSRLVYALRPGSNIPNGSSLQNTKSQRSDSSDEHAAKSGVLRDVFRLNGGSKSLKSTPSSKAPAGLGNWDNSCYQNSVLQALASVQSLREFFYRLQQRNVPLLSGDTTLVALRQIVQDLNDESNRGRKIWTPAKLKSMSSWQQQDAQEYFSKIMDQLEKDTVAALNVSSQQKPDGGLASLPSSATALKDELGRMQALRQHRMASHVKHGESAEQASQLHKLGSPLEGLLAQRVGCTRCGYVEGLSLIPFNCLTLPIGKQWSYNLSDCLDDYTNLEVIEGVECAKCTLLQARHQLRKHTEDLAVASDDEESPEQREETEKIQKMLDARLEAVTEALQDENFSDSALRDKCKIEPRQRVFSNKTKQAMIMRTPQCLVLHVNRSLFDETTGAQLKNYADVSYEGALDISPWCVGKQMKLKIDEEITPTEEWEMDPNKSMASSSDFLQNASTPLSGRHFKLSAVITHYGRHENGHYICYRKLPSSTKPSGNMQSHAKEAAEDKEHIGKEDAKLTADDEQWWRLSDEQVSSVTEEEALAQGGVFMLFYERIKADPSESTPRKPSVLAEVMAARAATAAVEEVEAIATDDDSVLRETQPEKLPADDETNAAAKMGLDKVIKENIKPRQPVATSVTAPSPGSAKKAGQDTIPPEQKLSPQPQTQKRISPTTMRTAGIRKQSSEDMDPFKGPLMVATT